MAYDKQKFKVQKLPKLFPLHWILNPGLAFNELVLGQRMPKVILIDRTQQVPLAERQFVPCEKCGALNDGRLWKGATGLGNWFGLICPRCGARIPCLRNMTSLLLLVITFPCWIWFKSSLEQKCIENQLKRLRRAESSVPPKVKSGTWVGVALFWGLWMFTFWLLLINVPFDMENVLWNLVYWLIAGVTFSLTLKVIFNKLR